MRHDGNGHTDEILTRIEHTRGEMDRTLSAIEQKFTGEALVHQGLDYLRNSGAVQFAQNLGGAAKHNPLPVALTGIGIAWLMALGREPARHDGNVTERMSSAKDRVGEKMSSMADTTRQQWDRARGGISFLVDEHPFVLGAIGLAVGAAVGASVPRTRQEDRLMGDASRNLTEKAERAGSQQLDKAREALNERAASMQRPAE